MVLNKAWLSVLSCTGIIVLSVYALPPLASAQTKNSNENGFLQSINQEFHKLQQSVQQPIQDFTSDLSQGVSDVTGEIQSQISGLQSQFQQIINKNLGAQGIPDLIRTGQQIEDTVTQTKTGLLNINAQVQARNERQNFHRQFTIEQSDSLLGAAGQQKVQQEQAIVQNSLDIATQKAQSAQNDHITQEVMKKIATQNAQNAQIQELTYKALREQNQLTATANVNLTDISQNLSLEQKRQQLEAQGRINAIYASAVYANALWNHRHK